MGWMTALAGRARRRVVAPAAWSAQFVAHNVPEDALAGARCVVRAEVLNTGAAPWLRDPPDGAYAGLAVFVDGELAGVGRAVAARIVRGERAVFAVVLTWPAAPGPHEVRLDLMISNVTWLSQAGSPGPSCRVRLRPAVETRTDALVRVSEARGPWHFAPGLGVHRTRSGDAAFPVFAESARGAEVTDVDGRTFVDVVMGWGACLLGHAEPRVARAVAVALDGSALPTLAHRQEIEVAEALCSRFGFGDHVIFGKNGSDVTTWAVRAARLLTGRRVVVFAGFHGWQDWNAALSGFAATGIPASDPPMAVRLPYGDVAALEAAVAAHAQDLAAVLIEPAATAAVLDDPYHERDGPYLHRAQELARRHGALFLLDEIFTGFRFRGGSAQRHYELRPELTCLGKALANGAPLAALVGRGDVLPRTIERLQYLATYRGEAHSFAAANETLRLHLEQDVPARVWAAGDAIREGVDEACRRLGLPAQLNGPPYRMYFVFRDGEPEQRMHWRTLLQQELARHGVVSHKGYVIPSVCHDDAVVVRCVDAFAAALAVVAEARARGSALPFLEIPDVPEEGRS
jgi:glutamate-1-semialdehyde 2,1-aminomutase